ncbi:cAMP-dependent protein kinase catalytic subunit alpha [Phytophthora cinnamomi]|uniref:cAMP-dependent protein kinase catalytic subunit alpha n=1 Tax=Phytophthora cinnamomi TaxID=4785 RepID=UPI00355A999E|nr:cAMP-dependent protein kinase catalytic subunit alpha [Phytophthora cinnamomi]
MEEGDNMLSSIHNTMFSTHDLDLASEMDYHQLSEDEDEDDSDSRRLSGNAFGLPDDEMNNFTDVRRFQNAHSRRPSYPTGTGAKKSKKYREYLHPVPADHLAIPGRPATSAHCDVGELHREKVIPFPWENIIEAVSAKRRSSGKKDISRANVIATMTAKEAARILVEAIDINAPDETIKYGFQSFDEGFIEDSSLRQANAADVKISDTLQRRRSSIRSLKSLSARTAMPDITDNDLSEETSRSSGGAEFETSSTSTSPSTPLRAMQSDKTLKNLLLLVESMAGNIARLQQDVSDLKNRDITPCSRCRRCRPRLVLQDGAKRFRSDGDRAFAAEDRTKASRAESLSLTLLCVV